MTRNTIRKRKQQAEKARHRAASAAPKWATVGALVASATFAGKPVFAAQTLTAPADQNHAAARAADTHRFDIPPGPLADAIALLAQQAGVTVTFQIDSLGMIHSPGVTGRFTVDEALAALLTGTGARVRRTSTTTAVIELDTLADSVSVTAGAPIVSSPKYSVPVKDIPQTIDVIPRAAMEQQGVTTLSEALRNVPGITLQAGEGGASSNTAGDMFNMRGFNASNSLFVDGVRDDGLVNRDVFNIEQVEVFMGPTGSDVGRGTAAGYVNMQTKTPRPVASASAILSAGSANQRRTTFDVNQPLAFGSTDSWLSKSAVRLNAMWQDSGVPGRDDVKLGSKAIAPSLALGLGTATRVNVSAQVLRQNNVPDYGLPSSAWLADTLAPTVVHAPANVDQENYYGSPAYDFDRGEQNNVLGRVEHDLGNGVTIRNQSRFNESHRRAVVTSIANVAAYNPVTNMVTVSRQGNDRDNRIFSNQTSVTDRVVTGSIQHALSAGVEYTYEQQYAPALGSVGTRAPVNLFAPNPNDPIAGYAPAPTGASTKGWTNTIALYGFDTVDLTPNWQVSGGVRVERYDSQYLAIDATGSTTTRAGVRDVIASGRAAVVYKINANGNVYVAFGSSVTPPGTANFTLSTQVNNQNNPNLKPQQSRNFEVGSKWDLASGRLQLTGAVFHTINKNVIYTADATAIPPIFNQDDGQRVNGATLGATGRVTDRWQVMASVSYLDSRLESQGATNSNRLVLTPVFSGSLWTTYALWRGLTVGGGFRATGDVFVNTANTIRSPGYHLIDALAEYAVNAHLSVRMNVYNVADAVYVRNVNNNGGRYNPGTPRSVLASAAVKF